MRINGSYDTSAIGAYAMKSKKEAGSAMDALTAATTTPQDELTLSPEAERFANAATDLHSTRNGPPLEPIRVENIREKQQQNLADLQHKLQVLMRDKNISADPPARLHMSGDGHVMVMGDHPQKEAIEQLFVDDPSLRNKFAEVSAQTSFLQAADEAMAFQHAYRKNPDTAVAEFSYLFNPNRSSVFSLIMTDSGIQAQMS
jgi:hypothetical protein